MKSLPTYISEKLIIKQKQKITPTNKQELFNVILDHFNISDGDLNDIDVSKLKEEDFYTLFYDFTNIIEKNNITEINISNWKLKELYCGKNSSIGMFDYCETLKTIILPNYLEAIGNFAFSTCRKLDNIIIPDSVKKIGKYAFWMCGDLHSIIIPDLVTVIGLHAFEDCYNLTTATIPKSVISIGDKAFSECPNLTITVPNEQVKRIVENSGFDGKIIIK